LGFRVPVIIFESNSRRIVEVNDVAAALFKTTTEAMVGQTVDGCLIAEERARLARSIGTYDARWGDVGNWQCLARDGTRFVASVRFHQAIHDGRLVHIVLATAVTHVDAAFSTKAAAST